MNQAVRDGSVREAFRQQRQDLVLTPGETCPSVSMRAAAPRHARDPLTSQIPPEARRHRCGAELVECVDGRHLRRDIAVCKSARTLVGHPELLPDLGGSVPPTFDL